MASVKVLPCCFSADLSAYDGGTKVHSRCCLESEKSILAKFRKMAEIVWSRGLESTRSVPPCLFAKWTTCALHSSDAMKLRARRGQVLLLDLRTQ